MPEYGLISSLCVQSQKPTKPAEKNPTERRVDPQPGLWLTDQKQTLSQASLCQTRQKRRQERVVAFLTLQMDNANTDYAIPRSKWKFLTEPEVKAALPDYHSQTSFKKTKSCNKAIYTKQEKSLVFRPMDILIFQLTNFIYSKSLECHDCNKILFH